MFDTWIDDALEHLPTMTYSCALDVTDDFPDGVRIEALGWMLGITRQAAEAECRSVEELRDSALRAYAPDDYEPASPAKYDECAVEVSDRVFAVLNETARAAGISASALLEAVIERSIG